MNKQTYYKKDFGNDNVASEQRRAFDRRIQDVCMVNVDGHPFPVKDWSQGGVLFNADSRPFAEGQHINMILRFKVGNTIEDIKISGEIIRKKGNDIAAKFQAITDYEMTQFDRVIEST